MRKNNQEITDRDIIEEILSGAFICRIAMTDGAKPYLLPFNYGYKDRCIYIHSAPEGKKIELLREFPEVCFEVEDTVRIIPGSKACNWSTLYRSAVGYGRVEIITDPAIKRHGLEIIMAQHGAPNEIDFDTGQLDRMVLLKLIITSVTGKQSSNWNKLTPNP
jgi:nitroimidazol reductase NimA-like FMN-containing flavoprotein (pyridoxamine 5'-phosphate oxidase superfamily)